MAIPSRVLHKYTAYVAVVVLSSTIFSGVLWRVLFSLFGVDPSQLSLLMSIHQGSLFRIPVLYTMLSCCLAYAMAFTGWSMLPRDFLSRSVSYEVFSYTSTRELHRKVTPLLLLPLLWAATTGFGYRFSRNALGFEKARVQWLLDLHQFRYPGNDYFSVIFTCAVATFAFYTIWTGAQLILMAITRKSQLPTQTNT